MICPICEYAHKNVLVGDPYGWETDNLLEAIGKSYVEGFAFGFSLSKDATYMEFCQAHADMMKAALLEAGSHPIPTGPKGSA